MINQFIIALRLKTPNTMKQTYKISEVASLLNLSERTIKLWIEYFGIWQPNSGVVFNN